MNRPAINVTPLIDVLLVLLIIFMVITPTKPNAFEAKIPREPKNDEAVPNIHTLVVSVAGDSTLKLNNEDLGTIDAPDAIISRLQSVFADRKQNGVLSESAGGTRDNIERTVFISAPRGIKYGNVVKVVDAVKMSGGDPISLQIDNLSR